MTLYELKQLLEQASPGPWEYDSELADFGNKSTPIFCESENNDADLHEPVCIIPHDDITEIGYQQVKANAKLIAFSPAYFRALLSLLDNCKPYVQNGANEHIQEWSDKADELLAILESREPLEVSGGL